MQRDLSPTPKLLPPQILAHKAERLVCSNSCPVSLSVVVLFFKQKPVQMLSGNGVACPTLNHLPQTSGLYPVSSTLRTLVTTDTVHTRKTTPPRATNTLLCWAWYTEVHFPPDLQLISHASLWFGHVVRFCLPLPSNFPPQRSSPYLPLKRALSSTEPPAYPPGDMLDLVVRRRNGIPIGVSLRHHSICRCSLILPFCSANMPHARFLYIDLATDQMVLGDVTCPSRPVERFAPVVSFPILWRTFSHTLLAFLDEKRLA